MTYKELLIEARKNIEICKACDICNGKVCKNTIPGPGAKGSGDSAILNYEEWRKYRLIIDTIVSNKDIDIATTLFETKLDAPIFAGPVGAVKSHYGPLYTDFEYNDIMVKGCAKNNILAFLGDGKDSKVMQEACKVIKDNDGFGIPTIKPWDKETVFQKLDLVLKSNPKAIAMDIDASGLPFLKNANPPAGVKTVKELKEIIDYAKKPFILKGVMSVKGALKAIEAGAYAIVVSNHGGRVLEDVMPTACVLEEICKAVNKRIKVFVDGGIRSGADIFKALALGADGVLIARPFVTALYGAKEDGISLYIDKLKEELKDAMKLCGASSLSEIRRDMIGYLK